MNTKNLKVLIAVTVLMMIAGCESMSSKPNVEKLEDGVTITSGTKRLQSSKHCEVMAPKTEDSEGLSVMTVSTAADPKGVSAAVQSGLTLVVGTGECIAKAGPDGGFIPAGRIGQSFTQNADIMDKMLTGSVGIIQSATTNFLSAKEIDGCSGGGCGGSPIFVQTSANSGSQADVDIRENVCPTGSCNATDK